jgi:DNA-binding NarL/FixJ family response regulator
VLRRREATPESLASAISAASRGDGTLAPDLVGRLMQQMGRLQRDVLAPRGIGPSGLAEREVSVLRLLADGMDTAEIAGRSPTASARSRTYHDLGAVEPQNRSHAVAYAMKVGLI